MSAETKKFLDAEGLAYFWQQVIAQDYPNNQTLVAVINAIDEAKADRPLTFKYTIDPAEWANTTVINGTTYKSISFDFDSELNVVNDNDHLINYDLSSENLSANSLKQSLDSNFFLYEEDLENNKFTFCIDNNYVPTSEFNVVVKIEQIDFI